MEFLARSKNEAKMFGGISLESKRSLKQVFTLLERYWAVYEILNPGHPVFRVYKASGKLKFCVPWMKHGDEGRGKAKTQVAMLNVQPVFPQAKHSLVSRFLYTNLPEEKYAILRKQSKRASEGNRVLDELLACLAEDFTELFHNGSFCALWNRSPPQTII